MADTMGRSMVPTPGKVRKRTLRPSIASAVKPPSKITGNRMSSRLDSARGLVSVTVDYTAVVRYVAKVGGV